MTEPSPRQHIRLTSHAGGFGALPIQWAAATASERGTLIDNNIGTTAFAARLR